MHLSFNFNHSSKINLFILACISFGFNIGLHKSFWQTKRLSSLLNEDPAIMERRSALAKRLELYRSAQAEIDAVAWSK